MMMNASPTDMNRRIDGAIVIQWDDDTSTVWTPRQLRNHCPCATCREKHQSVAAKPTQPTMLPVITAAEARPLTIESMRPVGNYAYNILFSDGHHSGLFTLTLLHDTDPTAARTA